MKNQKPQYVIRKTGTDLYCSDETGECSSPLSEAWLFDLSSEGRPYDSLNDGEEAVSVFQPDPVLGKLLASKPEKDAA